MAKSAASASSLRGCELVAAPWKRSSDVIYAPLKPFHRSADRKHLRCRASSSSSTPGSFGRSSSFGSSNPALPLLSSSVRSSFPSSCEDEQDDSSYLNAICYPDAVLDESHDLEQNQGAPTTWPLELSEKHEGSPSLEHPGFTSSQGSDSKGLSSIPSCDAALSTQQAVWRRGAIEAVHRAEENYRKAWRALQVAEERLRSTIKVAAELDALPPPASSPRSQGEQSVDISVFPMTPKQTGSSAARMHPPSSTSLAEAPQDAGIPDNSTHPETVDLGWDDGVWCIEACTSEPDSPTARADLPGGATLAWKEDSIKDAEGAISRSRAALDAAARELIERLEEEELQVRVIDHHIDALDQGGEHHVAHWLVDEMDALASISTGSSEQLHDNTKDRLGLAVPLDLDMAMKGYDEHAVRFLRHLPYDQVLKIRTIPPTKSTKGHLATSAAADRLESLLAKPASLPPEFTTEGSSIGESLPGSSAGPVRPDEMWSDLDFRPALEDRSKSGLLHESSDIFTVQPDATGGASIMAAPCSKPLKVQEKKGKKEKYHTKLVLLGCCVSSLAAYMVANFDLAVLAKDVAVIVVAMSLAFVAAQFVWRSGDAGQSSDEGSDDEGDDNSQDLLGRSSGQKLLKDPGQPHPLAMRSAQGGLIRARSPSWEQAIWLIGAFAVVLSLSTMVALACKAAQAGLTMVSTFACSMLLKIFPEGLASSASMAAAPSVSVLARHVSTSLWLVVGGEVLSSGVESLGSAAAWAMLLLCVAFSIASAPICLASSTSRRVGELLALARGRSQSD